LQITVFLLIKYFELFNLSLVWIVSRGRSSSAIGSSSSRADRASNRPTGSGNIHRGRVGTVRLAGLLGNLLGNINTLLHGDISAGFNGNIYGNLLGDLSTLLLGNVRALGVKHNLLNRLALLLGHPGAFGDLNIAGDLDGYLLANLFHHLGTGRSSLDKVVSISISLPLSKITSSTRDVSIKTIRTSIRSAIGSSNNRSNHRGWDIDDWARLADLAGNILALLFILGLRSLLSVLGAHLIISGAADLIHDLPWGGNALLAGSGLALSLVLGLILGLGAGLAALLEGSGALLGHDGFHLGLALLAIEGISRGHGHQGKQGWDKELHFIVF